jgi:3-oxoacyl-[acyl-carrier protein] reductase
VAKVLMKGLRKNSTEILVGWQSHLAVWCSRLAPGLLDKLLLLASPLSQMQPQKSSSL